MREIEIHRRYVYYTLTTSYGEEGYPSTAEIREANGFQRVADQRALERGTKLIHEFIVGKTKPHPGLEIITSLSFVDGGLEYSTKVVMKEDAGN